MPGPCAPLHESSAYDQQQARMVVKALRHHGIPTLLFKPSFPLGRPPFPRQTCIKICSHIVCSNLDITGLNSGLDS
eukprot:scaffold22539_cov21-Tisochrysis_lutea.AAC.1